ncbi:retrovirus-related pol polyprotein from transposon TNT 1-94 [Tanacetum coccineum]
MHNNIMAAGSRDRPLMLATGRYAQWQSRFLRYIDTRPNGDTLRKCILKGPYKLTTVMIPALPLTDDTPATSERTAVETLLAIIGDEIYLIVDACKTAHEMWIAIKRLQQGKEIAKPITPPSESASEEYSDPEQGQRDKDMQKNLALIAKYFKKIYKPTNNNLKTSSNSRNKNVHTTPRYKNDNQVGQFGNQRTVTVAEARETVGSQVVQQTGIQCFSCKEFDHFAKKCQKPKRVKDSTYHKEKMLMCKQAEKGIPLQADKADWLEDKDEEIDELELEAHYNFMAKIQKVPAAESGTNTEPLEQVDSNIIPDSPDMHDNDFQTNQNAVECDDECVVLANVIVNLKLDVDENKKIQMQLKKANTSLSHELKECKSILVETSRTLGKSNSIWDSCLIALQNKQTKLETYKTLNDHTVDYDKLEHKLNETLGLLAQIEIDIKEGLKLKAYEILVVKEKYDELVKQSLLTKSHYEGLVKEKTKVITDLKLKKEKDIDKMISMEKQLKFLNEIVYKRNQSIQTIHMLASKGLTFNGRPTFANLIELVDQAWKKHSHDHFRAPTAHDIEILIKTCLMPLAIKTQNDSFTFVHELKQEMHADLKYVESLENEIDELKSDKAEFSNMYDILLQECVSNDVMCSYLHSLSDLDAHTELQCLYLHKVKECECLAQKLSKQTETVSKEVYTELLRSFAKLEKHSISLELALQQCQEQMKNDTVCKEKASNVFLKEREQYFRLYLKITVIMEYLVNISKRRAFWSLNKDILKITILTTNTPYPSKKIRQYSEEEEAETMVETIEQYMSKTRANYGSGVARPKIEDKDNFELKGQFLKELRTNTFSGSDHEDTNEHIEKVLEIVDLFHIPNITIDQKLEDINNFQQEPDENHYQAWERFKELLMKCPQHYLTEMQEVILFYNGLGIHTRQILDSRGAISTATDAKLYKHNCTILEERSRNRVHHFLKVSFFWEHGQRLPTQRRKENPEEAYYTQFGGPFQGGGYRAAALGFYQRNNVNPSYQERRKSMEDTLSKFMSESTKRYEENSSLIKEI